MSALGITKFVTQLSESQTAFNTLYSDRHKDDLTKTTYNIKKLRQQLTKDYQLLVKYTDAMAEMKSTGFYAKVLSIINSGRKYFAETVIKPQKKTAVEEVVEQPNTSETHDVTTVETTDDTTTTAEHPSA